MTHFPEEPFTDPVYGLDAQKILNKDDTLALRGLLQVLRTEIQLHRIDDFSVRRIAKSMGSSAKVDHQLAPNEQDLEPEALRQHVDEMLDALQRAIQQAPTTN